MWRSLLIRSRRHVYQDLHPYCCTSDDCTSADRLFDSRHAWFAHELEAHHSTFQCVEGCSKVFETVADFEAHVEHRHEDLATPALFSALKRTSAKRLGLMDMMACRLCDKRMTIRGLQKHLGHHQEQLALFALPTNLDETGGDQDEDDLASQPEDEAVEKDDGQLTDTSDATEEEDLSIGKTTFCVCNGVERGMMIECANLVTFPSTSNRPI